MLRAREGDGDDDHEVRMSQRSDEGRQSSSRGGASRPGKKGGKGDGPLAGPGAVGGMRTLLWVFLVLFVGLWLWGTLLDQESWAPVSYSTFRGHLEADRVERVEVQGTEIRGILVEPVETRVLDAEETQVYQQFVTHVPSFGDDTLLELLEARGVEIETRPESAFSWWLILFYAVPLLILIVFLLFIVRGSQAQGRQMMSIGQSRARAYERTDEATTFDDVAGQEGAKKELEELIAFLKDPGRFERVGGEVPRGFLLVGPPGTGKTLLARAVAGEAEVPFFHMSGSDFMEMLVGVGASRVRNLFKEAKEQAPAIVFIDELDSVGRRRGAGLGGGHDEREQTLNQLLSEMDGFEVNEGVVVMAATNRPDILDSALLRPGRFDRRVTVDLPTRADREAILAIHARRKPLAPEVDLSEVAGSTPGFSGAELRNLLNEAALLAARKGIDQVTPSEIEEARDKILLGLERTGMALTEAEKELLAYHEAGHAVVAAVLPHADPVHKVTVVPRGRAMGVTQQIPDRDRYVYSREYLEDRLAILMGGRAAEELALDTVTSGAEDDLRQASQLARRMVLSWGMSEGFGRVAPSGNREEVFLGQDIAQKREYSDSTAREVDEEMRKIVEEAYQRARSLLEEHREGLDRVVKALLQKEEITGDEVRQLLEPGSGQVESAATA